MTGESQVTLSATGASSVTIWCTKLDHNLDKPIISIPMPNLKDKMDSETEPITRNIDIGKVKEIVTVQGMLIDEETEAAYEKKVNFLKLVKFYRSVTLTWGSGSRKQTAVGNINKFGCTETGGIVGIQKAGYESEKNFAVQFGLLIGTDK